MARHAAVPSGADWEDDAADMESAASVTIEWTARDDSGRILFASDIEITGALAGMMFRALS